MNTQGAQTAVVTGLAVAGAVVVIKDFEAGQLPPVRFAVGITFAGVSLAVLAQVAPELAGGTALLIALTSVLVYGGPALAAITKATGGGTTAPAAPAVPSFGVGNKRNPGAH